ncbi:hypothetical protein L6V77_19790 [Myxococcota bacterium]|nr:hypothetical protein [Myxococcota bacterium]
MACTCRPSAAALQLRALIDAHGGNVARVARTLGRSRQSIYRALAASADRPPFAGSRPERPPPNE